MTSAADESSSRTSIRSVEPILPYGRQSIGPDDIEAVADVLRSDWLTTGPKVSEFEAAFAQKVGALEAVAVSSGTAALHSAAHAAGIGPGDEVIVPSLTFAATANCVVFQGGSPIFADVDPDTLLIDIASVRSRITPRTKAIIAVDYAGQPCEYDSLRSIAADRGLLLVADASHALGGQYRNAPVGSITDLSTFSFHPVKHIATGEGGMITTDDPSLAHRMRIFRNHGIATDHRQREAEGSWYYEIAELGFNYRLSDLQCALGITQLAKLQSWLARRRAIAHRYDESLATIEGVEPLGRRPEVSHAYHLYVVRLDLERIKGGRREVFRQMRERGIGVNVHYVPVHLHPFYRERYATGHGLCPIAEAAYERILTLPLFPDMTDEDVDRVTDALMSVLDRLRR